MLQTVDRQVNQMSQLQAAGRQHFATDWHMALRSRDFVQNLSLAACVVIVLCGACQVCFLRHLFSQGGGMRGTLKQVNRPRA